MKSIPAKFWLVLAGCQLIASALVFSEFLSGKFYFAYLDIGSDSYRQVYAGALELARALTTEGFTGWSFQIGLGSPTTALMGDLTSLLAQSVGSDRILSTRIFVYLIKLALGGGFFFFLSRYFVQRWETAIISALAYSFCGFMVINGQWDGEATAFVFYPLIAWSVARTLQSEDFLVIPVAVAASLMFGVFFVSLGVFLFFICLACVGLSDSPKSMALNWIRKIFPLTVLGYLLASPYLVPAALQLMDSSRVGGGQSLIHNILIKSLSVSDWQLIIAQLGGLFHKDLFGVGNAYRGYFNYLEGPGFYFGLTLLILIPQLYAGSNRDRRILLIGITALVLYIVFPMFRFAAMGFAAPYFRTSTLWVTLLGLFLGSVALDRVLTKGVKLRLLAVGVCASFVILLLVVLTAPNDTIWLEHVWRVVGITLLSAIVLVFSQQGRISTNRLPLILILLSILEITLIARPSFVHGRAMVDAKFLGFNDHTMPALAEIRDMDSGIFRIEKNFNSVSLADAMAQGYMGIKSYSLHGRGMVDFHIGAGLLPVSSPVINYSNWLSNAGDRFVLNSFLGVKYFLAQNPINWPGFIELPTDSGLHVYRNEFVLPLGFVQTSQVERSKLSSLMKSHPANANNLVDVALFNAAIVDQPIEGYGQVLDIEGLSKLPSFSLEDLYFSKAKELQDSGLQIEKFASNHVIGQIRPSSAGILVFTIPFSSGWRLLVDGVETPMFRVDYGLLGATVSGGSHRIELVFRIPGLDVGIALGSLGMLILLVLTYWSRRARVLGSKL